MDQSMAGMTDDTVYEPAIARTPLPRNYIWNDKDALFERMRTLLILTTNKAPDEAWAINRDALLRDINMYMSRGRSVS